jgi:hypothetical protein
VKKLEDGKYELKNQPNDSPFSYHLYLKYEIEKAIETGQIHKYHFNYLRNILEKMSTFLDILFVRYFFELVMQNIIKKRVVSGDNEFEVRLTGLY